MLTSKQLQTVQESLVKDIKRQLSKSMIDFDMIREMTNTLEAVDNLRRKTWHSETFGVYEEIVDEVMEEFDSDDIPF